MRREINKEREDRGFKEGKNGRGKSRWWNMLKGEMEWEWEREDW